MKKTEMPNERESAQKCDLSSVKKTNDTPCIYLAKRHLFIFTHPTKRKLDISFSTNKGFAANWLQLHPSHRAPPHHFKPVESPGFFTLPIFEIYHGT